ncbi:MAG TPA: signal peptide peptidase SppA [Candidatus Binataceae bacterium]|nr:signal peptide peptidase SppA [Candidatus Binataceae bacterium]
MRIAIGSVRREVRVAILVALVAGVGALAIHYGLREVGIGLWVVAAAIVAVFYVLVWRLARIPRGAVLTIKLAGAMRESTPRSPLDQLRGRGGPALFDLRQVLEGAARDPRLSAVIIRIAGLETGLATADELYGLLRALGRAGKRTIALLEGDSAGVREYLVACGAGEIVANPNTLMTMLGVAAGGVFLRGALDKMKVQAQILQWKEYKGAAETFTRERMSPELHESLEAIVADCKEVLAARLAEARGLASARAAELAGSGFLSVRAASEAGLIDRAGYFEDLRAEFDPEGKDRVFVGFARYLRRLAYARRPGRDPRIALIHGVGPVVAGEPPAAGDFLSGEAVAAQFHRAASDKSVRAIVFRVNSPGGSALGSDLVWRAVGEARQRGKPVVVSMGDVAGSGGYYVAMGADRIVAGPATITGSIGVVFARFNVGQALAALGVAMEFVKSDEISDGLSMARALSPAELDQLDQVIGELYANFTAKVAQGRGLDSARTEAMARGRVWSGVAARRGGLVDELGGLDKAIEIARARAGINDGEGHELVLYPARGILAGIRTMAASARVPWSVALASETIGLPRRWAPATLGLLARGGALLLCPFF